MHSYTYTYTVYSYNVVLFVTITTVYWAFSHTTNDYNDYLVFIDSYI